MSQHSQLFTTKKKAAPQIRARKWIGTLNNPDTTVAEDYIRAWSKTTGAVYSNGQLEKGKEGTVHL